MFLGHTLLKVAALTNFLIKVLPPGPQDPPGIFERPINRFYDYIVVGAGSAGAIVATRLSEDQVSVLLLEAGVSDLDDERTLIPGEWRSLAGTTIDWQFKTIPQKHSHFAIQNRVSSLPRGKVLGGSSTINVMSFMRGSRLDYDEWARDGCTGWSYNDVLPYFKKIENVQTPQLKHHKFRGSDGPVEVKQSESILQYFHQRAAHEIGFNTVDCNGENQIGFCVNQQNIKNGERCGTANCYLRPVLHRRNLQISINSHVIKVIFRRNIAIGVDVIKNGQLIRIFARREVILSADTIGSPQILLLSGIGPRKDLRSLKIPVLANLPVGKFYKDHVALRLFLSTNASFGRNSEKLANVDTKLNYILHRKGPYSENGDGHVFTILERLKGKIHYPDSQVIFLSQPLEDDLISSFVKEVEDQLRERTTPNGFIAWVLLLHEKSTGYLKLASRNPFVHPEINPNYLAKAEDVNGILRMIRLVQTFEGTKSWKSISAKLIRLDAKNHCQEILYNTDNYWRCIIRNFAVSGAHQTSTCRMGSRKDPTAVVDSRLRVIGIKNLRVVDASVMRNLPSGNTNAPTMMIGEKAADMIKRDNCRKR